MAHEPAACDQCSEGTQDLTGGVHQARVHCGWRLASGVVHAMAHARRALEAWTFFAGRLDKIRALWTELVLLLTRERAGIDEVRHC